jgi:hypothetical protein
MNDEKTLEQLMENGQQHEDTVTGSFTRVEEIEENSWYDRIRGSEDYEWSDIFTKYEQFMGEAEDTIESYRSDVETTEPYMRLNADGDIQDFYSRDEVISHETVADELEIEDHTWTWNPTEDISVHFKYHQDSAYNEEQVGVQIDVDEVNGALVNELVELSEDWFGKETDWVKKSSGGHGLLY